MSKQKTTKKTDTPMRSLIKEQLLPEFSFISYCNTDDANKYTSGAKLIDPQFIRAAKSEGLLTPLYSADGPARQPDGSIKNEIVDYYSPLQLYIVTQLRRNIVLNGRLWNPEFVEAYPDKPIEERPRYISWGTGMGFPAKEIGDPAREKSDDITLNPYVLTATFDDFLRFIHTVSLKDKFKMPIEEIDIFESVATFNYELSAVVSLPEELKKYGLDPDKLNFLRTNVGRDAAIIDPLELWYYYIERHPGSHKSYLKGDAGIAQSLYKIYNLITDTWERVTGQESRPLLELLASEHGSGYLTPRIEYLRGTDVSAMKQSIADFNAWSQIEDNDTYVTPQIREALAKVATELDDYEKRYGDRSYGGSYRTREDHGIKYNQLDDDSKRRFDQWKRQNPKEEDWSRIEDVIDYRLSEIQRSLQTVYRRVGEQLRAITSEAWDTSKHLNHTFWAKHSNLSHAERVALFQKEVQRLNDYARVCQGKEREFNNAVLCVWRAFCAICRKQPIQLHAETRSFDSQPSICDKCVKENKTYPDTTKGGEWRCWHCDTVLYKFVHGNTLSARTQNGTSVVIELKYGELQVQATCPKCKNFLEKKVEFGWLP
jgi:hypothetical protein